MAPDEPAGARPPVVLRIKLRYDDVDAMVQRFAANVGKSGLFLPTKSLQPVGMEIKFELRLSDDRPVLVGLGRVKATKAPDAAMPKATFGMAVELMRVTKESREVILRMLERRKAIGLPDIGIPMPADIDAARRAEIVETGVRDSASGSVPSPIPAVDSQPVLATQLAISDSGPVLTAPRHASGPIAVAKTRAFEPLAPEPVRKRRAVQEVIDSASGPIAALPAAVQGVDDDVDVGAVLLRARALASGNLEAELDALREAAAAPIEISIEAASAELAKQLGGAAVRRDRSARWAPPPAVSAPEPVPQQDAVADAVAPPEPVPQQDAVADAVAPLEPASQGDMTPPEPIAFVPQVPPEPQAVPIIDAVASLASPEADPTFELPSEAELAAAPDLPAPSATLVHGGVALRDSSPSLGLTAPDDDVPGEEVAPDQIADEIHRLSDSDLEEIEHTQVGGELPAQLAAAGTAEEVPAEDDSVEPIEEIHDFEILAEADAEDADLLASDGEADASAAPSATALDPSFEDEFASEYARVPVHRNAAVPALDLDEPPTRPSDADFASRLELSDEFERGTSPGAASLHRPGSISDVLGDLDNRPRPVEILSRFDEPSSYEPSHDEPDLDADESFTLASALPDSPLELDPPQTLDDGPRFLREPPSASHFDASDVLAKHRPLGRAPARENDGFDLETALEDLDVDLDDLAIPQAASAPSPTRTAAPVSRKPKRAETDIPIDIDDIDEG